MQQSCHSLNIANIAPDYNRRVLCQGLVAVSVGDLIRNEIKQRTHLRAKLQVRLVNSTIQTSCVHMAQSCARWRVLSWIDLVIPARAAGHCEDPIWMGHHLFVLMFT